MHQLFTSWMPVLDARLQLLLIIINALNLIFYNPTIITSSTADIWSYSNWKVPGGVEARHDANDYSCPIFYNGGLELCEPMSIGMYPLGVFQTFFLLFWVSMVIVQVLPGHLYQVRLGRLRAGDLLTPI